MRPVRQRYAGVSTDSRRRGHPGDNLERNPGGFQRRHFLPATTENEGVATFQTHHMQALAGETDQQFIDAILRQGMPPGLLAGIHRTRRRRNERNHLIADQIVVHHRLCLADQAIGAQREQFRVTRPSTHQTDFTEHDLFPLFPLAHCFPPTQ